MDKKHNIFTSIIHEDNINITNLNEVNNNILLQKYDSLIDNEPSKFFKKKHKIWEKEKELLNDKIIESFNNLNDNYINLEQIIK